MWNRGQLKESAKAVLRVSYWKAFLISLILLVASGENAVSFRYSDIHVDNFSHDFHALFSLPLFMMLLGTLLSISLGAILISIFVFGSLEVGAQHYFLESTQMRFRLENVARGFSSGRYRNVVTTMLLRKIYNFLWYLLLFIPGIIMSYSYAMVPFLLAENPGIPPNRAIEMSMQMTDGHKWQMFVLDLSFIGWELLGVLALGVGILFVNPYYNTTHAQLYIALRAIALDRQIFTLPELENY